MFRLLPWTRAKFFKLIFFFADMAYRDDILDLGLLEAQFPEIPPEDSIIRFPGYGDRGLAAQFTPFNFLDARFSRRLARYDPNLLDLLPS